MSSETIALTSPPCPGCQSVEEITVSRQGHEAWRAGALLQNALPELSAARMERLKTGYCTPCWDRFLSDED